MHLIHGLPGEAGGNDSSAVQGVCVVKKRGLLWGCSSPAWSSLFFAWDSSSVVVGSLCWDNWWDSQLLGRREGEGWVIRGLFFKGAVLFLMSGFEVKIVCMEI